MKHLFTKTQLPIAIRLLEKARDTINVNGLQYVCLRLSDLAYTDAEEKVSNKLRDEIARRLGDCGAVTGWLQKRHNIREYSMTKERTCDYRKRWCDSMIAELQ